MHIPQAAYMYTHIQIQLIRRVSSISCSKHIQQVGERLAASNAIFGVHYLRKTKHKLT